MIKRILIVTLVGLLAVSCVRAHKGCKQAHKNKKKLNLAPGFK